MKHLLLFSLLFTGCVSMPPETSLSLMKKAELSCAGEPELDGRRVYCQAGTVQQLCDLGGYDLKICGRFK